MTAFRCVASLAANDFHSISWASPTNFGANDIEPAGKMITAPPFSQMLQVAAIRVSRFVASAISVFIKINGQDHVFLVAGARRSTRCVMIFVVRANLCHE